MRLRPSPCSPLIVPPTLSVSSCHKSCAKSLHHADVIGISEVEEGPNVQLTMNGMREQRGGDLVSLLDVLHRDEKLGEHMRRDGDIFDERDRSRRCRASRCNRGTTPTLKCQKRLRSSISIVIRESNASRLRRWMRAITCDNRFSQLARVVTVLLDQQHRFRFSRNDDVEADIDLAHEMVSNRRSIKSQALTPIVDSSSAACAALSKRSKNNRTTPRCLGRGSVRTVASFFNPSVPSERHDQVGRAKFVIA